jgi:hypothetical protein
VSASSNLRVCALLLAGADVIRPSLDWVLTPRAPQNLVAVMARARDPRGFAELSALCAASPAGRTMKTAARRRAATILAVKGETLREITVGDCLELSLAIDSRSLRANKAMGFYQLLHEMGVFSPDAPSTFRAFGTTGQLSPAQLIDRYGITYRPVRDVLVAYLAERQPMLDHTTLRDLAFSLGGLFWRDLERHHPGIASLHLAPEVAAAWKQRVLTKTRKVTGPDGQTSEVQERRAGGLHNLAAVRAFYLDIAQWAMEDPARWAPWAAPCPIRAEDLARQKEIRARKSRMDQRTRERLPVLPALLSRVNDMRTMTAARLATAHATATADTARIWAQDPDTGKRRDLTGKEDRAFWTWAAVETLRHTGIRIEELTELSHHSLIQYTLPGTGEPVPLLQIAPSKTDTERLLVISPELADVLAAVIHRIRGRDGALGCVASYDSHERVWNPPMPLLFQRRFGIEHRAIPAATLREWISGAFDGTKVTDAAGQPLRFTPHDFRRLFITDAVLHGMPPHIAQLVAGHRDINTTMGYKAVYPDEVINGHRAFIARRRALRPSAEYRVPTEQEWEQFLGHFEHRKLSLGTCGRSYATPCIHEHACLTEMILSGLARRGGVRNSRNVTRKILYGRVLGRVTRGRRLGAQSWLDRPVETRMSGMPRWTALSRACIAFSFCVAAARVVSIAATSPSQPCSLASWSRSRRLAWIPSSRVIWAGSTRSSGHLTQAFSCAHGVPWSRPHVPRATFRSSKWARNSSHSQAVRSRYSSLGRSARRRAMNARWCEITSSG